VFTIDGIQWPYPCAIERVAELTASEISGMLLDRSYFNDVLGTYLQYTVTIAVPLNNRDIYSTIYEMLTAPVDGHTFTLPYNQGTLTLTGRITNVSDVYVRLPENGQYWKGTRFTVIGNHPSKQMSLGEMIVRGRAPMPEVASVDIGDLYVYTANGWQPAEYDNADNMEW
jgi:hypothetical protein